MAAMGASTTTPSTQQPSKSSSADTENIAPVLRLPTDILHYFLILSCSPPPSSSALPCTCIATCTNNCSPPSQPWFTYSTLLSLRLAHRSFNRLLTPSFLAQLRNMLITRYIALENYTHAQWLSSLSPHARWLRIYDAWFDRPCSQLRCYRCLEVKPLQGFTSRHARNGLGLGGGQAKRRWCKRCLVEGGRVGWGRWERENWVERNELVVNRGRRGGRPKWSFDPRRLEREMGRSLIPDEGKPGICARCHLTPYELWWGCAGCFEEEETRRQEQDRKEVGKVGSGLLGTIQAVRKARSKWKKIRGPSRDRKLVWIWEREFWSQLKDFSEGLIRKNSSGASISDAQLDLGQDAPTASERGQEVEWRPLSTAKMPTHGTRREIRCAACWIPNCPRRRWVLGLAYERPLPKDRWCGGCREEQRAQRLERRRRKSRETAASVDSVEALGLDLLFGS